MTYTVYESRQGRIDKTVSRDRTTYKAWDFKGEYLGPCDTESEAHAAIQQAIDVHQSLRRNYENRNR